jgi:catechol 2,3-dioxygenase-like lactoylglutathione lyase family enzyme
MEAMAAFYEQRIGLKVLSREDGFVDFDAGGARLALHRGTPNPSRTKICFYAPDVSKARGELVGRGVKMSRDPGPGSGLKLCDGKDPEGNVFQLSNRK